MFSVATNRPVSYFKRFKMEIELFDAPPAPVLPPGYYLVPWQDGLLDVHAEIMFASFLDEIDGIVFPSLGARQGCYNLMNEIRHKHGFMQEATWLIVPQCPSAVPISQVASCIKPCLCRKQPG